MNLIFNRLSMGQSTLGKVLALFVAVIAFQPVVGQRLTSPNGTLMVELITDNGQDGYGRPSLQIYRKGRAGQTIINRAALGMNTVKKDLSSAMKIVSSNPEQNFTEKYEMITGKRRYCENEGVEKSFLLQNKNGELLSISIRAFNDGVAFRYLIENAAVDTLIHESTSYAIGDSETKWMQRYKNDYEGFYEARTENQQGEWGYPLLVEKPDSVFILLSEANITRGNAGSRLSNRNQANSYQVKLGQDRLAIKGKWLSPWRTMIIGSLADIVESTLITDVSDPSEIKQTSWIQPGNVAWIYWAHNHSSNDYKLVNMYTDLAAEMGWTYNLIDWKWNTMANGGDIEDAVKYALKRHVKPLLWYNSGTGWIGDGAPGPLDRLLDANKRKQEYAWLRKIGVAGVKIDFFNGDHAAMMTYYIDLLADAAKHKLMVNLHGSTIPRGWARTYPNLMTMEAVYGAEWYNNNDTLTSRAARHNATLPFTRNVIGSMDYTPGTFSDSQHKHITSHAHELALMIAFESGWQHRPDRPETYRALPAEVQHVLTSLPTAWDDTKLLSGYPGEDMIIARRKGKTWYIAGLNGTDQQKTLLFNPRLLNPTIKGKLLIQDGEVSDRFRINNADSHPVEIHCLPRGGFVAVVEET